MYYYHEGAKIMLIGYIRVSKKDQSLALQLDAMKAAGVTKIFQDTMSGAKDDRPQFKEMLNFARTGDTVVVWRLDRLGRSLKSLIETVMTIKERGIDFMSLTEHIDTSTPAGKFTFHLFGALAEMERDIIIQRTTAGLEAARARGRNGGRPPLTIASKKIVRARELYEQKQMTVKEIMDTVGIRNKMTFYKYVVHSGEQ